MTQPFTKMCFVAMFIIALATAFFYAICPVPAAVKDIAQDNKGAVEKTAVYATVNLPVGQPLSNHAIEKHDVHALRAEECGSRPDLTMYRADDQHYVDVCKTSAGVFGIFVYIIEQNQKREVTALEKDKMNRLQQVIQNLINGKYGLNLPPETPGIIVP